MLRHWQVLAITLTTLAAFGTSSASAETLYWDGTSNSNQWNGSSGLWNTEADGTGTAKSWTDGDDAVFTTDDDATSKLSVTGTHSANSLAFVAHVSNYQLRAGSSPQLNLGGGGISGAGSGQIWVPTTLTADQTWSVSDIDLYNFAFDINGNTLTLATGNEMFMQGGAHWAGTGTITLTSGSTIRFWDIENTFSGLYDVVDGTLLFNKGDANHLADTADVTLGSGSIFDYDRSDEETFDILSVASDSDIQTASQLTVNQLFVDGQAKQGGVTYTTSESWISQGSVYVVPEPASLALLGAGLLLMAPRRRVD